jgi:septal ring factor EnvC (AmiA/AmiB activator)
VAAQPPTSPEPDPNAPATREDVRSLRRWLIVVGVWAVAASAIGIIALIASDDSGSGKSTATDSRINQLERNLSNRIQGLEDEVSKAAKPEDVEKLDSRIKDLSQEVSDAKDASESAKETADDLKTTTDDLEKRVEDLEQRQQNP